MTFSISNIVICQNYNEKKVSHTKDTIDLKESVKQEDIPVNEYLINQLKPIRENFKRLNSIENWTKINVAELWQSTEGGEAKFYYQNENLEKIITRHFGETFQNLTEFYLINGELSFVFEKSYEYNRPIYYDSKAKQENNDSEEFDFDKSEVIEDRSYFKNGELIHKVESGDCGAPFASDYLLEEQKRLLTEFKKLVELEKKK